jgi:hypothetical protein
LATLCSVTMTLGTGTVGLCEGPSTGDLANARAPQIGRFGRLASRLIHPDPQPCPRKANRYGDVQESRGSQPPVSRRGSASDLSGCHVAARDRRRPRRPMGGSEGRGREIAMGPADGAVAVCGRHPHDLHRDQHVGSCSSAHCNGGPLKLSSVGQPSSPRMRLKRAAMNSALFPAVSFCCSVMRRFTPFFGRAAFASGLRRQLRRRARARGARARARAGLRGGRRWSPARPPQGRSPRFR